MGFYAIIGMEMDKNIKDVTKRYMVNDVLARKDAIKTMTYSSSKIQCEELCCTWLCCEKKLFRGRLRNWFSSIHQILHKKGRKILFDLPFQKPLLARFLDFGKPILEIVFILSTYLIPNTYMNIYLFYS